MGLERRHAGEPLRKFIWAAPKSEYFSKRDEYVSQNFLTEKAVITTVFKKHNQDVSVEELDFVTTAYLRALYAGVFLVSHGIYDKPGEVVEFMREEQNEKSQVITIIPEFLANASIPAVATPQLVIDNRNSTLTNLSIENLGKLKIQRALIACNVNYLLKMHRAFIGYIANDESTKNYDELKKSKLLKTVLGIEMERYEETMIEEFAHANFFLRADGSIRRKIQLLASLQVYKKLRVNTDKEVESPFADSNWLESHNAIPIEKEARLWVRAFHNEYYPDSSA